MLHYGSGLVASPLVRYILKWGVRGTLAGRPPLRQYPLRYRQLESPNRLKTPSMALSHGTERIESERLILRRIDQNDFEFFVHLHADPEVARYLSHGKPRSSQESRTWRFSS